MDVNVLRELVRKKVQEENSYGDLLPWLQNFYNGHDDEVTAQRVFILLDFIGYEVVPKWEVE